MEHCPYKEPMTLTASIIIGKTMNSTATHNQLTDRQQKTDLQGRETMWRSADVSSVWMGGGQNGEFPTPSMSKWELPFYQES